MGNPTYGSYTLPGRIQSISETVAAELATWKPSGKSGQGSEASLLAPKRITIAALANYGSVALRDAGWEAIKAGLAVGPLRSLVASDTLSPARYYEARIEQLTPSLIHSSLLPCATRPRSLCPRALLWLRPPPLPRSPAPAEP